jgi:hypothetical protein
MRITLICLPKASRRLTAYDDARLHTILKLQRVYTRTPSGNQQVFLPVFVRLRLKHCKFWIISTDTRQGNQNDDDFICCSGFKKNDCRDTHDQFHNKGYPRKNKLSYILVIRANICLQEEP